ncbi:hypothetical protein FDUTEX481_09265 [Tolypothrix sp. PCC 7601]|nr:hypothetical protein FDUTEX481_09265 [Tolypothrix sp. PCC 7601]
MPKSPQSTIPAYSYFQVNEPQFYISRKGAKAQSNKEIQISACGLNT